MFRGVALPALVGGLVWIPMITASDFVAQRYPVSLRTIASVVAAVVLAIPTPHRSLRVASGLIAVLTIGFSLLFD
jgi:hypothetical protein